MGRSPLTFKQSDLTRALRAAKKTGVVVQVTIDLERKTMTVTPVKPGEASAQTRNEWDEVLPDDKIAEVH
jgi:hypothetical protein